MEFSTEQLELVAMNKYLLSAKNEKHFYLDFLLSK